jgi:hypothetical protein
MTNTAFEKWCYTAEDSTRTINGKPIPLITTFLFSVCQEDQKRFELGIDILRMAFEAGQREGLSDDKQ